MSINASAKTSDRISERIVDNEVANKVRGLEVGPIINSGYQWHIGQKNLYWILHCGYFTAANISRIY